MSERNTYNYSKGSEFCLTSVDVTGGREQVVVSPVTDTLLSAAVETKNVLPDPPNPRALTLSPITTLTPINVSKG